MTSKLLAGRYEVGERLGVGAMAEVRAARDQQLDREVAVKRPLGAVLDAPEARERFHREARAAAQVVHPNVVTVLDFGEDENEPFLVLERLPGRTLADELRDGPVSVARAREVARQLLAGLAAVHDAGLLHRDIKPGNVLLASRTDVKLGDFGIARAVDAAALTSIGMVAGSACYLAPEVLDGGKASVASDLYSVGALLYEALSGRRPYEGESALAVARAMHAGPPPSLREVAPGVDPALADAVDRAIAAEPKQRFPSAFAMAASLGIALPKDMPTAVVGPAADVDLDAPTIIEAAPTIAVDVVEPDPDADATTIQPVPVIAGPPPPTNTWGLADVGEWLRGRGRPAEIAIAAVLLVAGLVLWAGGRDGGDEPVDASTPTTEVVTTETTEAPTTTTAPSPKTEEGGGKDGKGKHGKGD